MRPISLGCKPPVSPAAAAWTTPWVVDGDRVLNPAGLRMANEFVRHKMLDAVGDMAMAGAQLQARFTAHRPGHALNNRLVRALMADRSAWVWSDTPAMVWVDRQVTA